MGFLKETFAKMSDSVLIGDMASLFDEDSYLGGLGWIGQAVLVLMVIRVMQRMYFVARGHSHYLFTSFDPPKALYTFFKDEGISCLEHEFNARDGVRLKYRRVGTGKKLVLLANGVGTDLYMWLPMFKAMFSQNQKMFEGEQGITLIAPSYRGLFGSNKFPEKAKKEKEEIKESSSSSSISSATKKSANGRSRSSSSRSIRSSSRVAKKTSNTDAGKGSEEEEKEEEEEGESRVEDEVDISIDNCVQDILEVLDHASGRSLYSSSSEEKEGETVNEKKKKEKKEKTRTKAAAEVIGAGFDTIIGWSMGAQTSITALGKYPELSKKLLLLNPTTGRTLHYALQAFVPLPEAGGAAMSALVHWAISHLRPSIRTNLWTFLNWFSKTFIFRLIMESFAFFAGFPPEIGVYFTSYMKDVFSTRNQTRGLLDLISALDAPCTTEALHLRQQTTTIISGLPDNMTGVYHAHALTENFNRSWRESRSLESDKSKSKSADADVLEGEGDVRVHECGNPCKHVVFTMGSHFVIQEWPGLVGESIMELIEM